MAIKATEDVTSYKERSKTLEFLYLESKMGNMGNSRLRAGDEANRVEQDWVGERPGSQARQYECSWILGTSILFYS